MIERLRMPAALLALGLIVAVGATFTWYKSVYSFGFGDQALFHAFGRWVGSGQIYIRDFIHFRTPGTYYHVAFWQALLGDNFRSTSFAVLLEGQVYQAIAAFALALAASRAILGRASCTIAVLSAAVFLAMTPIFQMRTALPALAMAAYLMTMQQRQRGRDRLWAVVAGLALGLSYWAGQETYLFFAWSIFWIETIQREGAFARRFERLALIGIVSLFVIAAGIAALAAAGMPVGPYLYYTLPYAFTIQPAGMDMPFPPFNRANFLYYAFFIEFAAIAAVFFLTDAAGRPGAIALLSFTALRLISALGRADYLHLVFSISEFVVLIPISIALLPRLRFDPRSISFAVGAAVLSAALFAAGIRIGSSALLAAPPLLAVLARIYAKPPTAIAVPLGWTRFSGIAGAAAIVMVFYPHSFGSFQFGLDAIRNRHVTDVVNGAHFPERETAELKDVRAFLADHPARSIYSYPIRSEYYAFVPQHATRLTYLEPQTTAEEVAGVVADLKANPPDVVVQDMGQVFGAPPSFYPIIDYVASHYDTVRLSTKGNLLELRVPRGSPRETRRMIDRYGDIAAANPGKVEFAAAGGDAAPRMLLVARQEIRYRIDVPAGWAMTVALDRRPAYAASATVALGRGGETKSFTLSNADGETVLPLPPGDGPVDVTLSAGVDGRIAGWVDPRFEAP